MKPQDFDALLANCRCGARRIIAEEINVRLLSDAKGNAILVGTYKLVCELHGSDGVHSFVYILEDIDDAGNVLGMRSQSVGVCCKPGCTHAAEKSSLVKCAVCKHQFHPECSVMIGNEHYCDDHVPSLLGRFIVFAVRLALSPFIRIDNRKE